MIVRNLDETKQEVQTITARTSTKHNEATNKYDIQQKTHISALDWYYVKPSHRHDTAQLYLQHRHNSFPEGSQNNRKYTICEAVIPQEKKTPSLHYHTAQKLHGHTFSSVNPRAIFTNTATCCGSGNVPALSGLAGMSLRQAAGPLCLSVSVGTDMLTSDRTDSWQEGVFFFFLFTYSLSLSASSQLWPVCWWTGWCVWHQRGAETNKWFKLKKIGFHTEISTR